MKLESVPLREKDKVKRGQWTVEEDDKLSSYSVQQGACKWCLIMPRMLVSPALDIKFY